MIPCAPQVHWSQERFDEIVGKLKIFLKQAGFKARPSAVPAPFTNLDRSPDRVIRTHTQLNMLSINLYSCLVCVCSSTCLSVCLSICLSLNLSACLSVSVHPSVRLFVCAGV